MGGCRGNDFHNPDMYQSFILEIIHLIFIIVPIIFIKSSINHKVNLNFYKHSKHKHKHNMHDF
jgi:hypothetical protein